MTFTKAIFVLFAACCIGAVTGADDKLSEHEHPLAELKPDQFVNLLEGVDKLEGAPSKFTFASYTGDNAETYYARAKKGETQAVEFATAAVPAELKGQRVTFVIPCGLSGEGQTVFGVPFLVSVNDKPLLTIHSSVQSNTWWQNGETCALLAKIRPGMYTDPLGLLLLSVPASAVEVGKPAHIKIETRPSAGKEGAMVLIAYMPGGPKFVENAGGVAKLAEGAAEVKVVAAAGRYDTPPLVKLDGRRDDSVCLTGNATGDLASRNKPVAGQYTYYDGRTDAFHFPHWTIYQGDGRAENYDEGKQTGGWIAFTKGKLTDGDPNTKNGYPLYLQSSSGTDIVFDLGADCLVDELDAFFYDRDLRNIEVFVKASDGIRWVEVQAFDDRASFVTQNRPKLRKSPQVLPFGGTVARWVRINNSWKAMWGGFSELQIWGRPVGAERPVAKALAQLNGEKKIETPTEISLGLPNPAMLPLPQQYEAGQGQFVLRKQSLIVVGHDASERTARTAELLAEDLKEEAGLNLRVLKLEPKQIAPTNGILIRVASGSHSQGYSLSIAPDRIEITGDDEQGAFYATQSLMQLLKPKGKDEFVVSATKITDWPDKPFRSFCAAVPITPSLLKALGRYRVTHYVVNAMELIPDAVRYNDVARDRFVQYAPLISYNGSWNPHPQEWSERKPGETYEQLNQGRVNPCPSNPDVWKYYFSLLDKVSECYGDYVNVNMDEMYQPENGSRWNVCERCRARHLSGHVLMAETIAKIQDYLATKGKKVMIIDSPFYIAGISNEDDKTNDWRKSAEILGKQGRAKDIIVYVWHGEAVGQRLRNCGLNTILWGGAPNKALPAVYSGSYLAMADGPFTPAYLFAQAQTLWSPARAVAGSDTANALLEHVLPTFNRLWTGITMPSRRPGAEFSSIELRPYANRTFKDDAPGDGKGWVDLGPNYDLRALTPGRRELGGVPFDIINETQNTNGAGVMVQNEHYFNRSVTNRVEIPVGRKAASINFLHTLDDRMGHAYWVHRELVGYYFINYEDGNYEPIELKYAVNICNFDGLNTWWDASPRGKTMQRATLAWTGQMGCGNTACLYKTEWVNPFPQKKINSIYFCSTRKPAEANPILIAATVVAPTDEDMKDPPKPRYAFGPRSTDRLNQRTPVGRQIDLTHGKLVSPRVWKTDESITIEMEHEPNVAKVIQGTEPAYSSVANLLWEDEQATNPKAYWQTSTTVTLPQPHKLSGIRVNGPSRGEFGSGIDHWPSICAYVIITSDAGSVNEVLKRDVHIAEEDGPLWLKLNEKPITSIRIVQTRSLEGIVAGSLGLDLVELYDSESGQ